MVEKKIELIVAIVIIIINFDHFNNFTFFNYLQISIFLLIIKGFTILIIIFINFMLVQEVKE